MTLPATLDGPWQFGPVTVWRCSHVPGQRGEPQARQVLAAALGGEPAALPLVRDPRGRPELAGSLGHLGTGWSHSGDVLLVALGEGVRLGVDLELLRPRPRLLEIIQRFFHPEEVQWLQDLPDAEREHWFFRVWCAKEALLKAHGQGISFGLHRLRLAPGSDCALHLHWCDPALGEATRWHLHEWQASDRSAAALAWYPQAAASFGGAQGLKTGDNARMSESTLPDGVARTLEHGLAALGQPAELAAPLLRYLALLHRWNGTYNLTAIRDPQEMVTRHLLDSLAMQPHVSNGTLADLGTGPRPAGHPLAIACPGLQVTLVESNGKKARFMREAVRQLGLGNARVAESRAEALDEAASFDQLTARAMDTLEGIIRVGGHLLRPGGVLLAMKGVYPHEEIAALPAGWQVQAVTPLQVPGLHGERHLVVVSAA